MSTILEDIFKKNNNDNKVFNLNNTFFKSFMNASSIIKLIDIRKLYLDIIRYEQNKEKDVKVRSSLKKELDILYEKKNKIENDNFALLKKKIAIIKSLTEKIDIKKIELETSINEEIIKNTKVINEICMKIDSKNNEINSLSFNHVDKDMLINTLKYKISNLENYHLDYLNCNKKDDYNKEIKKIFNNQDAIRCYTTYLFEMIAYDIDNLNHTYAIAKNFASHSYKKDENIRLENNSIILEFTLNSRLNKSVSDYVQIILENNTNNTITELSLEKLKHNTIIHTMDHFAKNYKDLINDEEIIKSEYQMIKSFIMDLKNEIKDTSDSLMIDVINGTIDIFKYFNQNIKL